MPALQSSSNPVPDTLLAEIATYVTNPPPLGEDNLRSAFHCLLDSLSVAMLSMQDPRCSQWLGSVVSGTSLPLGARLPGTFFELDPSMAAYDLALCLRWQGLQCLWQGEETISPADPLAALLPVADWLGRNLHHEGQFKAYGQALKARGSPPLMRDVLSALVRAQEIQGALAETSPWRSLGIDQGVLSRIAATATVSTLLGADWHQVVSALSLAFQAGVRPAVDPERTPWNAASDAEIAVFVSLRALAGEQGCPQVLTAPLSGFQDACHGGRPVRIKRTLGSSVSEQIIYNVDGVGALSAQTAVEAARRLRGAVASRFGEVDKVEVHTHAAGLALELEGGPGALDRVVAEVLVSGRTPAPEAERQAVERLLQKVRVSEDPVFTADSCAAGKRALPNSVSIRFADGTRSERVAVEYPLGHYRRRIETLPLLFAKAEAAIESRFDDARAEEIMDLFDHPEDLYVMPVPRFVELWVSS